MNVNEPNDKPRLDLEGIRAKLAGQSGKQYWRSLEEVADLPEFQAWMDDEFPNRSTLLQINRRDLLKFMGASMALVGMAGCRSVFLPEDKVVPYVKQPEELVPGKALFYASSILLAGYATGVLVEQHEGRPTLIVGNPDHPASLGALDSISQAQILGLYDPDRADNVLDQGEISTIETFDAAAVTEFQKASAKGGSGLRILTGAVTSPTLIDQIQALLKKYPNAKWHAYEPAGRGNVHGGAELAFGKPLDPIYDFSAANVVLSLDSDFLNPVENPGSLRYARDFAKKRSVYGKSGTMNRLYVYESAQSLVGAMADHRYPVKSGSIYGVAAALAAALGIAGVNGADATTAGADLAAIAKDLQANPGAALVVAGSHQPAAVHALVFAINEKLGAFQKTVSFIPPVDATADKTLVGDLKSLVDDLNGGKVDQLLVLDSNPAYTAPADYKFAAAMPKARFKIVLGLHEDETGKLADWFIPMTHSLEEWGDAKAYDGTVGVIQPLLAPLYSGYSSIELISRILGKPIGGYDLVRAYWKKGGLTGDYEKSWRTMVHQGLLEGSASKPVTVTASIAGVTPPPTASGTEINFRPDPSIYDGRYANNGWLQELPKPLTKITWDNVILMSPSTAQSLSINSDDIVKLNYGGGEVDGMVFIMPGHVNDSITVNLGYGRQQGGIVATVTGDDGGGFNAYSIRTSKAPYIDGGVTISRTGDNANIASTQGHSPLKSNSIFDDREVIHDWTLADFTKNIDQWTEEAKAKSEEIKKQNLYPDQVFDGDLPQWGMTVDMNTCIGCNACVTACQAENNIPVVGKMQVARHREMHWIRIDRYYSGEVDSPAVTWQPVACVQCEKAPCEPVCPVAATVHSHEGLNQMIYNRCVGTRYCSNNCPYKVRRFNYFNFSDNQPNFAEQVGRDVTGNRVIPGPIHVPHKQGIPLLKMLNNPDVTVRGRGIMEKCTYCTQRISEARIEAKKANVEIKDGEIVTACQQACPTQSIVFGNIADKTSQVWKLRNDPRAYLLLEELQTRPRTSHLAKLRNPNPDIKNAPHFEDNQGVVFN